VGSANLKAGRPRRIMTTIKSTKRNKEPTVEQLASGLIISVGEARKMLGADSKELDDMQVARMILDLSDIAYELLQSKHFAS
jgi:hypothetical protein